MIPVELFTRPIVGQFWLDPRTLKLYEIISYKDKDMIYANEYEGSILKEKCAIRLPLNLILLWRVQEVDIENIGFSQEPKSGQAWANISDGEVFIVSPNQLNPGKVTLLSTGPTIYSLPVLIHESSSDISFEKSNVMIQ